MIWETLIRREIPWPALEAEQSALLSRVKTDPERAFLLISEPRPTFTYGRASLPSERLWTDAQLRLRGVDVFPVSRGGRWTYHGPGQILVYPLVSLPALGYPRRGIVRFLEDFRTGLAAFLGARGLAVELGQKPFGVFVGGRKLASFGVHLQNGVCSHGLALYLKRQRDYFDGIHPCGVAGGEVTSLEELGHPIAWEDAAGQLAEFIKKGFKLAKSC